MYRLINIFLIAFSFVWISCSTQVKPDSQKAEQPNIFPDYKEVTIPYNIAPLDFRMADEGTGIAVTFQGKNEGSLSVKGKTHIEIPAKKWAKLLEQNKGSELEVSVTAQQNGKWVAYKPFSVFVSADPVDYGIAYRLIAPGYEVYSKMGIYRNNFV